jgi:hypothetical protein
MVRKEVGLRVVDSVMEKTREVESQARGVLRIVANQWDHIDEHVSEQFPEELEQAKIDAMNDLELEAEDDSQTGDSAESGDDE